MPDIFGNNKPQFTSHFLERYAERIFFVGKQYAYSWIKNNYDKFYKDLFYRLNNSEVLNLSTTKYNYVYKKYGNDVRFLKYKKFIFVVRDFKNIVTFMREDEL